MALLAVGNGAQVGCGPLRYQLRLKPISLKGTDYSLPSGLRVFFDHYPEQRTVVIATAVDCGSAADPRGKEGLAHLLEHLWFHARPGGGLPVMDRIKELGGIFQAYTLPDVTLFITMAPQDALADLLRLEAQRLLDPLAGVDDRIIALEKRVVDNEIHWRRDRLELGGGNVMERLNGLLFPKGHEYNRAQATSRTSLEAITRQDLARFVKRHYRPAATTVVVTGPATAKQSERLVLGAFPKRLVVPPGFKDDKISYRELKPRLANATYLPPAPARRKMETVQGNVPRRTLLMAWTLPGGHGQDRWLAAASSRVLASALSREVPRATSWKGCKVVPGRRAHVLACVVALGQGASAAKVAERIKDSLYRVYSTKHAFMNWAQFNHTRTYKMAELMRKAVSPLRAIKLAHHVHHLGRTDFFASAIDQIQGMTEIQVEVLMRRFITRARTVSLLVLPRRGMPSRPPFSSASRTARWLRPAAPISADLLKRFEELPPEEVQRVALSMDMKGVRQWTLSNGLRVIFRRQPGAPFLSAALYTRGGAAHTKVRGAALLMTTDHEARSPFPVVGRWFSTTGETFSRIDLDIPAGNLWEAMDLLGDRVRTTHVTFHKVATTGVLSRPGPSIAGSGASPGGWRGRRGFGT